MYFDFEDEEILEEDLQKNRKRGVRRKNNVRKAIRKKRLADSLRGGGWYGNLHQYSKNKIHCSCQMCRFRSDWNPDQKTHSDQMRKLGMEERLAEYSKG